MENSSKICSHHYDRFVTLDATAISPYPEHLMSRLVVARVVKVLCLELLSMRFLEGVLQVRGVPAVSSGELFQLSAHWVGHRVTVFVSGVGDVTQKGQFNQRLL